MGDPTNPKIRVEANADQAVSAMDRLRSVVQDTGTSFDGVFSSIHHGSESVSEGAEHLGDSLKEAFEHPLEAIESLVKSVGGSLLTALESLGPVAEVAAGGIGAIAAAGAAVGGILFGLADHAANAGEEVEAFSIRTGIAAQNVGPLQFAVKSAGGSLETLSGILTKVEFKSASDQGGKFATALQDIGINADAFKRMDSESQILALAHGFEHGAASGNLMADAIAIGGKGMAANIPLLEKMNDELLATGERMGVAWSPEALEQSRAFKLGVDEIETVLGTIATRIGVELLPVMSSLIKNFAESPGFINGVIAVVDGLAHGLGVATIVIGTLVDWTIQASARFVAMGTFVTTLGTEALGGLYHWVQTIIGGFQQWVQSSSALSAIGDIVVGLKNVVGSAVDWIIAKLESIPLIGDTIKKAFDNAKAAFDATTAAGVSVGNVTTSLGGALLALGTSTEHATSTQLSLNKAHSEGAAGAEKLKKQYEENAAAIAKLWDDAYAAEQEYSLKGLALQLAKLDKQQQNEVDGWNKKKALGTVSNSQYWEAIAAIDEKYYELAEDAREKDFQSTVASLRKIEDIKDAANVTALERMGAAQQHASQRAFSDTSKSIDETEKLWEDTYATQATMSGTATDAKIAQTKRWADNELAKLKPDDINWQQHYDAIVANANIKMQAAQLETDKYFQDTKKLLSDLDGGPGGWTDTFSHTLTTTHSFTGAATAAFKQMQGDIEDVFGDLLNSIIKSFLQPFLDSVTGYAQQAGQALASGVSNFTGGSGSASGGSATNGVAGLASRFLSAPRGASGAYGPSAGYGVPEPGVSYGGGNNGGGFSGTALGTGGAVSALAGIAGVASGQGVGGALGSAALGAGVTTAAAAVQAGALTAGTVALGAATFGIGAAAVGVALLVKHFLTVSQAEKDARTEFAKLQDAYGSLPATIKGVGAAYASIGLSGTKAQHDLQAALDATHDSAQAEDKALAQINAVLVTSDQYTTAIATGVADLTKAGQAFGGIVPDQFKAAVTELANMQGVTDDERASLLAMTGDVKPNFDQLTQTASNYGITLAGLGPKFQEANIEGRAKGIFDDFSSLTKAGADVGGVLLGMGGKISKLVDDSEDFGVAIPENMRPLIQNLFDSGQLLDDNGKRITDLGQITWEDTPLDDSTAKFQQKLDQILDTLKSLPGAAANAANGIASSFNNTPPISAPDIPGRASGGSVRGGQPYIVGERRPELFVPWTSGTIIPNVPSGDSGAMAALHAEVAGLRADTRRQNDAMSNFMSTLPETLRHSLRGLRQ